MKASIDQFERRDKRGNFGVTLKVQFTQEEQSTLTSRKLWDHVLFEIVNEDEDLARQSKAWDRHHAKQMRRLNRGGILGLWEEFFGKDMELPKRILPVTIRSLANPNGITQRREYPAEIKNLAAEWRKHLTELKEIIDFNTSPGRSETFEL